MKYLLPRFVGAAIAMATPLGSIQAIAQSEGHSGLPLGSAPQENGFRSFVGKWSGQREVYERNGDRTTPDNLIVEFEILGDALLMKETASAYQGLAHTTGVLFYKDTNGTMVFEPGHYSAYGVLNKPNSTSPVLTSDNSLQFTSGSGYVVKIEVAGNQMTETVYRPGKKSVLSKAILVRSQ